MSGISGSFVIVFNMSKQYLQYRSIYDYNLSKSGGCMDFELSARSEGWRRKLQAFFDKEVVPRNRAYLAHVAKGEAPPFMADLQARARDQGLWNLGLPELSPDEPGTRL